MVATVVKTRRRRGYFKGDSLACNRAYLKYAGNKFGRNAAKRLFEVSKQNIETHPGLVLPFCGALGTYLHLHNAYLADGTQMPVTVATDSNEPLIGLHEYLKMGGILKPFITPVNRAIFEEQRAKFNVLKPLRTDINAGKALESKTEIIRKILDNATVETDTREQTEAFLKEGEEAIAIAFMEECTLDYNDMSRGGKLVYDLFSDLDQSVFTLMLWLNKAGVNGLYRENSKGQYNIPWNKVAYPSLITEDEQRAFTKKLQRVELHPSDFRAVEEFIELKSVVYFDPPYADKFAGYQKAKFNQGDWDDLLELANMLHDRGHIVAISNSDNDYVVRSLRESKFTIEMFGEYRSMSSDSKTRGEDPEVFAIKY